MRGSARADEPPDDTYPRIVTEVMSIPHVKGRRISVLNIHDRVEGRGLQPRTVADRFDLDIADIYRALAYYHDHPEEMTDLRRERERLLEKHREEVEYPEGVTPPTDG